MKQDHVEKGLRIISTEELVLESDQSIIIPTGTKGRVEEVLDGPLCQLVYAVFYINSKVEQGLCDSAQVRALPLILVGGIK